MVDMLQVKSLLYPDIGNPQMGVSPYPGMSSGIDLRIVMDEILDQYGHWVMIRHYDMNVYSEYWNEETHESVGGPPHPHVDYVVRSRKVLQRTGGVLSALEMPAPPGMLNVPYVVYYLKWDVVPSPLGNSDEIFEFPWDSARAPASDEVTDICTIKYNILESVDLLGDAGQREYYLCICKADRVGW